MNGSTLGTLAREDRQLRGVRQVLKKMGLNHEGKGPPGLLFHWAVATSGGFRVVDVWKTKEQYERFAKEQIGPYAAEAGIPGPPEVTYTETHNYLTAG